MTHDNYLRAIEIDARIKNLQTVLANYEQAKPDLIGISVFINFHQSYYVEHISNDAGYKEHSLMSPLGSSKVAFEFLQLRKAEIKAEIASLKTEFERL